MNYLVTTTGTCVSWRTQCILCICPLLSLQITHEDVNSLVFLIIFKIVLDLQRNKDAVFLDSLKYIFDTSYICGMGVCLDSGSNSFRACSKLLSKYCCHSLFLIHCQCYFCPFSKYSQREHACSWWEFQAVWEAVWCKASN